MIVVQEQEQEEVSDEAVVEDLELDVEQIETVEYIEVDEPEEINIEIEETVGSPSIGDGNYAPLEHTHPISQVEELSNTLHKLASVRDYYSAHSGFAEFRPWKDKNPNQANRLGYFVSLVNNNDDNNEWIEICNTTSTDVYGVIVSHSGFCGKQSTGYNMLDEESPNRATNTEWAKVCLLGTVEARVYSSENFNNINIGDYVVPDEYGCATKSQNNIGFKVIMKEAAGTGVNAWNKVVIALVPQNDNVARVMKKLEEMNNNFGVVVGRLDELENTVDNNNISISGDLEEAFGKLEADIGGIKTEVAEIAKQEAQKISDEATKKMEEMTTHHKEALNEVSMASSNAQAALDQINKHQDNLTILAQNGQNIAEFFADATEDEVSIGTILRTQGDVSMLKNSSDALQHLVCHVDVYSVGNQSPTEGLSYDGAQGALGPYEYIYVPIVDHWEHSPIYTCTPKVGNNESKYWFEIDSIKYYFTAPKTLVNEVLIYNKNTNQLIIDKDEDIKIELSIIKEVSPDMLKLDFESEKSIHFEINTETSVGRSYVWGQVESGNEFWWSEGVSVIHSENVPTGDYELWYTHNDVQDPDTKKYTYNPGTLYRKLNSTWIAVATINDKNARTMSYINQTADEISSTITNVGDQVSTITQRVDKIEMAVEDGGQLSEIQQTAENIRLGVYAPSGEMSSLELLLGGLSSNAVYVDDKVAYTILDSTAISVDGKYYTNPPSWNGSEFVFNEEPSADGTYCFASESKDRYYHNINGDYEVYMINDTAIASINTRVTDAESEITRLTEVNTELGTNLTAVQDKSDENSAQISSIASMQNTICLEQKNELNEEEKTLFSNVDKYNKPPIWDGKSFVFQSAPSDDGVYCIVNDDTESYYKILTLEGNIVGYEQYGLSSAKLSVIKQDIDKNGASISMVVDNEGVKGGVIAKAINDQSEVLIEADKIGINGFAVFKDNLADGTTTISGNYIKTGVITSNNYSGPVTYRMYGAKISTDDEGNKIITASELSDCIYYTPIVDGELSVTDYYYADSIKVNEKLSVEKQDTSVYIACDKDFDLVPSDIETNGTKFDLNVGTIFSKNFSLDRDGDLTITGRITATSGYIGNGTSGTNGFTIKGKALLKYTVEDEFLNFINENTDKYILYFVYDDKYYAVSYRPEYEDYSEIVSGDIIIVDTNNETARVEDETGVVKFEFINCTVMDAPTDAMRLHGIELTNYNTDVAEYYLGNNQISYDGKDLLEGVSKGNNGVYLGPDGIGLGNGNFYVNNLGNLTTNGLISMWSDSKEVLRIENGGIKLSGNITWDLLQDIESDVDDAKTAANEAVGDVHNLAVGKYKPVLGDGETTFISGTYIYSPNIYGGEFVTVDNEKNPRIVINEDGIVSYNSENKKHGFVCHPSDLSHNDGFSFYSDDIQLLNVARYLNNLNMTFHCATQDDALGKIVAMASTSSMQVYGTWDFSSATVKGLVATFG